MIFESNKKYVNLWNICKVFIQKFRIKNVKKTVETRFKSDHVMTDFHLQFDSSLIKGNRKDPTIFLLLSVPVGLLAGNKFPSSF